MKVNAFKIDVIRQTISEVKIGGLKDYYRHIGNDCQLIQTGCGLKKFDVIMVDEEGLLHQNIGGFEVLDEDTGLPVTVLVGNGIVVGTDEDSGDDKEPAISKEDLIKIIRFIPVHLVELHLLAHYKL